MKYLILTAFLILTSKNEVTGTYSNHFGETITLNKNFTFRHSWKFDLATSWSHGTWRISNDTVYLTVIPVHDTLRPQNKPDSLILSATEKPVLVTDAQIPVVRGMASGGQNRFPVRDKLFYKDKRLYEIDSFGKLKTEKVVALFDAGHYDPWFSRQ